MRKLTIICEAFVLLCSLVLLVDGISASDKTSIVTGSILLISGISGFILLRQNKKEDK